MPRTTATTRTAAGLRSQIRSSGTYLVFNGTADVTVTSQLFYQNTGYTVSLWIRRSSVAATYRFLTLGSSAANNQLWSMETTANDGTIDVFIRTDANVTTLSSIVKSTAKNLSNGAWHHIVFTDNNGTAVLYIDGVADATNFNYTRSGVFTLNRTGIGALVRAAVANQVIGEMDDVRIWNNTVLNPQQVSDLYFFATNPSTPTSWYKFDEGSGTTATDSGSLATNGTITNATYSSESRTTAGTRTVVT